MKPSSDDHGFKPVFMPDCLFDFQKHLAEWNVTQGRSATFADCGLGKSLMELVWAENVVRHTNKPVLLLTPIAVGAQMVREGEKFGIECKRSRDGKLNGSKIVVTNYEKLHLFDPNDFVATIADEVGIIKNYAGATRNAVIEWFAKIRYRLLASATPAPNDYTELGNGVEALGIMRRVEMLARFFIHDSSDTGNWRLKGHAQEPFWKFMASWSRAVRKPSDLGFENKGFDLPPYEAHLTVLPSKPQTDALFPMEAITLDEQRAERRSTMDERVAATAAIANADNDPFVAFCSLNPESAALAKAIKGAQELSGTDSDDEKEEKLVAFSEGKIRCLVTKPSLCSHGLNWQHCARLSFFPSHSHESFYQSVRRCWRFGQKRTVHVHIVTTESESRVLENMRRKEKQADDMFARITEHMRSYYHTQPETYLPTKKISLPQWT